MLRFLLVDLTELASLGAFLTFVAAVAKTVGA